MTLGALQDPRHNSEEIAMRNRQTTRGHRALVRAGTIASVAAASIVSSVSACDLSRETRTEFGEVRDVAVALGLTAETLSAAGFSAADTQEVLSRLAGATLERGELQEALAAAVTGSRALAAAIEASRQDPWSESLRLQSAAARTSLLTASNQVESKKIQLRQIALDGFPGECVLRVEACNAPSAVALPTALRVGVQTDANRRRLQADLTVEARTQRLGTELPSEVAARLSAVRSATEVVAAQSRLEANLAAVTQAMGQF